MMEIERILQQHRDRDREQAREWDVPLILSLVAFVLSVVAFAMAVTPILIRWLG